MQPTILIVDDEKHTRDGLRRLLEDEYDVYVAEDIGGAISVLERETDESLALREVLDTIRQVAPSSANVLVEGESGTGKELAAHAIHKLSRRNQAKFVV